MLGPSIKSRGADFITVETYVQGKTIENPFFLYGPKCLKTLYFWLFDTQGYQMFRAVRPHHRADKCITRDTNNHQCFIYGPQCVKCECLAIRGGPINNQTGSNLLPSYPLQYINLNIKYRSNPIKTF